MEVVVVVVVADRIETTRDTRSTWRFQSDRMVGETLKLRRYKNWMLSMVPINQSSPIRNTYIFYVQVCMYSIVVVVRTEGHKRQIARPPPNGRGG